MIGFIRDIFSLLRIKQWIKNFFVLIPLFFAGKLTGAGDVIHSILAFFTFSLISSVIYIVNDVFDKDADKLHPRKKHRPIPSGKITPATALLIAVPFFVAGGALSLFLNYRYIICLATYFLLNIIYTLWGKHVIILDVLFIASGFVLRVIAGSLAIEVVPSNWMMMTTFFLSLFLGFGKRRNEYIKLDREKGSHRKVLNFYDETLLNHLIFSSCAIAIISYAMYTISPSVTEKFHNGDFLIFTIPFVTFVLFRYVFIIWKRDEGDPTEVVLQDIGIIISGLLWLLLSIGLIYLPFRIL
ncbi:MAG: decaprenyl-phosphate phosphoribosyltransferase [Spirochaetales bacterium]|nr:decaprenyl-phosphate phosphoribosyltransferase [Spirochaetales bacterium]